MSAHHLSGDDARGPGENLSGARSVLAQFTEEGRSHAALQPSDLTDRCSVAVLGMLEKMQASEERNPADLGAWLRMAMNRGVGTCSPLRGAADGLHVLVLDAQAVAAMLQRLAIHDRIAADVVRLRRMRGAE